MTASHKKKEEYSKPAKHRKIIDFLGDNRIFTIFKFRTAIYGKEWTGWSGHARKAIESYCEKILKGLQENGFITPHRRASTWAVTRIPSQKDLDKIEEQG